MTKLQAQQFCELRVSPIWREGLKPYLEGLKQTEALGRSYPATEWASAANDVKRVTMLDTIDRIISEIENAEKTLAKLKQ